MPFFGVISMKAQHILSIAALLVLAACQQAEPPPAETVGEPEIAVREAPAAPRQRRLNLRMPVTTFTPRSGLLLTWTTWMTGKNR